MHIFPRWANTLPAVALLSAGGFASAVVAGITYYATPSFWEVGYMPTQPVSYSHQLHAQELGIDCRYCHTHVDKSKHANIPSVSTCMACHTAVDEKTGYLAKALSPDGTAPSPHWVDPNLRELRSTYAAGDSVPWRRVHKLPDYVMFNHQSHITAGVSCYSCHGRVDQMEVVYQHESLSMGWCLECHRAPEQHLLDSNLETVTNLRWAESQLRGDDYASTTGAELAQRLEQSSRRQPPEHCGACHY